MNNPIIGRLKKLYKHKAKWARKNNFQAYRLYDKDIPDFPYVVDIYKNKCLIHFRGNQEIDAKKNHYPILEESIIEVTGISKTDIHYLERSVQTDVSSYMKSQSGEVNFNIEEGDLSFQIKFNTSVDTGIFIDHRPLRQKLRKELNEESKVLNLFSHTGCFSVACAKAGATVTSVDLSNTYLAWSKENFALNGIEESLHRFIKADVLQYVETSTENGLFDIVILDPPTYSQSKSMEKSLDIQRDHRELVKGALKLVKPLGKVYLSTYLRDFKLHQEIVDYCKVKDLTKWSIPEDFRDAKIHKLFEIMK